MLLALVVPDLRDILNGMVDSEPSRLSSYNIKNAAENIEGSKRVGSVVAMM